MNIFRDIDRTRLAEIQRDFEYTGRDYDGDIYHYTSPSGLIGIMNGERPACLRFTSADYLNDKEEGKYILKVLERAKNLYREHQPNEKVLTYLEGIERVGNETTLTPIKKMVEGKEVTEVRFCPGRVYICSFSRDGDSLPMWNYYVKGNSYRGYNLGFDSLELRDELQHYVNEHYHIDPTPSIHVERVIYDEQTQLDMIGSRITVLERYAGCERDFDMATMMFIEALSRMKYIFKNPCFRHESEVRAFVTWPDSREDALSFREGNGGVLVPYLEFEFRDRLRSVTLSPLVNDVLAEYSVGVLLRNNGIEGVKIAKSTCPVRY